MQPGRRAERHGGGQLHPADTAELLDLRLLQPAVAADRELPVDLLQRGVLQRRDQVVDVAELPGGARSGDDQEARRLEVAGQCRVRTADQHGGTDHGDVESGVGARRAAAEPFDLQQVADAGRLGRGAELGVLGERDVVVGQRAVDHRRGAQDHAVYTDGRGRGQHGLGAAHVVRGTGGGIGLQVEIERQVHHHIGAAQLLRDGRIAHVEDVPRGLGGLSATLVDGDDLLDLLGGRQTCGEQLTDTRRGSGDGHDGAAASGAAADGLVLGRVLGRTVGQVSRCANLRIWGTHRASPAVVFSTYPNDAYVPGGVHPAAGREQA